jgi:hypothetical protein
VGAEISVAPRSVHTMDSLGAPSTFINDAMINSGMAFLNGELEKRDPRLLDPLKSIWWPRDIFPKTGGGWVDYTSQYFVDYASTGGANNSGIIGSETNDIPIMQANVGKDIWQVFTFANIMRVPFVDQQKLMGIGRSLDNILDDGIRLNQNKSMDSTLYLGFQNENVPGLVNNSNVTIIDAPIGASGFATWAKKTPVEILNDINQVLYTTWENSGFDLSGMANHVLVPIPQYALLQQIVSTAGNQSILKYVLENNIGVNQGVDVFIGPLPFCAAAGTGGVDRMVAYVNAENRLNFDYTVPLSRVMTQPNVQQMAYETAFTSKWSQVKFLYYPTVVYMDGI